MCYLSDLSMALPTEGAPPSWAEPHRDHGHVILLANQSAPDDLVTYIRRGAFGGKKKENKHQTGPELPLLCARKLLTRGISAMILASGCTIHV